MILANVIYSFIVMATVITIVNYNRTVIMILNYDPKTFIVQATSQGVLWQTELSLNHRAGMGQVREGVCASIV
jgi:hypothetical protein